MRARIGTILQGIGGALLFFQVMFILSLFMSDSSYASGYRLGPFLASLFVFAVPGVLIYKKGEKIKNDAGPARTAHRQEMSIKRWFRLGNVLRVIGWIFLIFFGMVALVIAVTWSTQENDLEILIIFFILFFIPGVLMYWAGTRLNRKEEQPHAVRNESAGENKPGSSQAGRNTDQEWKKYSREPIPNRSAYSAAAKETASAQSPPSPPRRMICPGCGAQNTVPAKASVACEYCGSTLSNL